MTGEEALGFDAGQARRQDHLNDGRLGQEGRAYAQEGSLREVQALASEAKQEQLPGSREREWHQDLFDGGPRHEGIADHEQCGVRQVQFLDACVYQEVIPDLTDGAR